MTDRKGDPSKQPPECKPVFTPTPGSSNGMGTWSRCPHMLETYSDMSGERYGCDVCGAGYYLDYDDMR